MSDTISTNDEAASALSTKIKESLADYLGFAFVEIQSPNPTQGSIVHDGFSGGIDSALTKWGELITADANVITGIASSFGELESTLSAGMLGVGESA
ncbi:MAG: hypothetical protein FWE41_03465 [Coriobacteriia bacterium]|nr:hypothetical protein [Coriobacteriia bacterium]MCL2749718.1 hypothetical protein [Coriobacteriia bacterium]